MAFFLYNISFSWMIRPEKTFWLPKKQNLSIMLCHHLDMNDVIKQNLISIIFISWQSCSYFSIENFPEAKIKD